MKLADLGKTVVHAYGRNEKITCSECGRRRYGCTYEVTGKARAKKAEAETVLKKLLVSGMSADEILKKLK